MDENFRLFEKGIVARMNCCRKVSRVLPEIFYLILSIALAVMPLTDLEASTDTDSIQIATIAELLADGDGDGRLDRLGERVTVRGRATVGTGVFSDRYMILYIQDGSAGIMVFSDTLDTQISKGDLLEVTGTLKLHASKPEIVVEHLEIIKKSNRIPDPAPLSQVFAHPDRYRGLLVSGDAVVKDGNYGKDIKMLQIGPTNGIDDSLHIFVSRSNVHYEDFKFDLLEAGDRIHIKGILIRYTSGFSGKTFYQILPRNRQDITIPDLRPVVEEGTVVYADLDPSSGRVYVLLESGLWGYEIENGRWHFLDGLEDFEGALSEYEFGFNRQTEMIQLWSRGLGQLYTVNPETYDVKRSDRSVDHKNQLGHFPFYRDSTVYAFGGYGYWEYQNIMVFYDQQQREWGLQNVKMNSPVPRRRIPQTGVYDYQNDRFYVYGGYGTQSGKPADQSATNTKFRDIWMFSFEHEKWDRVLKLDQAVDGMAGTNPPSVVGSTNKMSSSFYLPQEGMWFIPGVNKTSGGNSFFLKPVHLPTQEAKGAVIPEFGSSNNFMPSNYFYYPNSNEVVFVGLVDLVNADTYPLRVYQIPADSLMAKIREKPFYAFAGHYYYLIGLLVGGGILFWLYKKQRTGNKADDDKADSISLSKLKQADWLREQEEQLLEYLNEQDRFMESHEIEELLWSNVDSYDYRRRLRNDTIKAINEKVKNHYPGEEVPILRKKDPNDNRRYLYGLNKDLLEK